jgi:hypothetical protein
VASWIFVITNALRMDAVIRGNAGISESSLSMTMMDMKNRILNCNTRSPHLGNIGSATILIEYSVYASMHSRYFYREE